MDKNQNRMKKTVDRNLVSIVISVVLVLSLVFYYVFCKPNFLVNEQTIDKESLYNLLTVNTIFAGFIYTMLGNMVEFSARKDIQELDTAGYIDPYFSPMYFGLFYFLFSILIELIVVFFGLSWKLNLLYYISLSTTLLGLIFFVISTFKMRRMINKIRNKI